MSRAHTQHSQPAPRVAFWYVEVGAPWRWAGIYAAAIVCALLLSHAGASGWLPW